MSEELLKKIAVFWEQYRQMYGSEIVVDNRRLENLSREMPEIRITGAPANKQSAGKEKAEKMELPDTPLWNFMREIKDCTKCPLGHSRTKFVFGAGSEHADIMFVGEAPGAEEDRTGIPFVGRAGKLLDKMLAHIRLKREDIFIANILKCRPPNNRDPLPEEVRECIPYLHRQIELIRPKVIVALGRVAAQNLLNTNSPLKQMRGRLWNYQGVDMIVTYHPAAILRNPGLHDTAAADFRYIDETRQKVLDQNSKE